MMPEHFYDYQLIEVFIDMLQDEYEKVFIDPLTVYNLILLHFPEYEIDLGSIEAYYNVTSEEIDSNAHLKTIGIYY